MHWYVKAIRNHAVFRGRASRSEYWWFLLSFIPRVNPAYMALMVFNSQQGDNRYGPFPE